MSAPTEDAPEGAVVNADTGDRSLQEARLRAARKLRNAGLLETGTKRDRREAGRSVDGYSVRYHEARSRQCWLSPFGAVIVDRLRGTLADGRRVRWGSTPVDALGAVRREALALQAMFLPHVRRVLSGRRQMNGFAAAFCRDRSLVVREARATAVVSSIAHALEDLLPTLEVVE